MGKQVKTYPITVIQGDDENIFVSFDNSDDPRYTGRIDTVFFSCTTLNIQKQMSYAEDLQKWTVRLPNDETINYAPGNHKYDITIRFVEGNQISTSVYESPLSVLAKNNRII